MPDNRTRVDHRPDEDPILLIDSQTGLIGSDNLRPSVLGHNAPSSQRVVGASGIIQEARVNQVQRRTSDQHFSFERRSARLKIT
jgi:hypothetical protein